VADPAAVRANPAAAEAGVDRPRVPVHPRAAVPPRVVTRRKAAKPITATAVAEAAEAEAVAEAEATARRKQGLRNQGPQCRALQQEGLKG
jgi:hypothetical protein